MPLDELRSSGCIWNRTKSRRPRKPTGRLGFPGGPRWSRRCYMSGLGEDLLEDLGGRVLVTADARVPAPIAPALGRLLEGRHKHGLVSIATRAGLVKWEVSSSETESKYLLGYKDVSRRDSNPDRSVPEIAASASWATGTWYRRRDSNPQPTGSEPAASTGCWATSAYVSRAGLEPALYTLSRCRLLPVGLPRRNRANYRNGSRSRISRVSRFHMVVSCGGGI